MMIDQGYLVRVRRDRQQYRQQDRRQDLSGQTPISGLHRLFQSPFHNL